MAEIDPRPGGIYRVLVAGQHQSAGEYVEVVPMEKVVFTFGWEQEGHPIPPGSTTVEISLHPEGDKTLVRLTHRGLPDDAVERPQRRMGRTTSSASRSASPVATPVPTTRRPRSSEVMNLVALHDRALDATTTIAQIDVAQLGCRRRAPTSTCGRCSTI